MTSPHSVRSTFCEDVLHLIFAHLEIEIDALEYHRVDRATRNGLAICLSSSELLGVGRSLLYSRLVLRLDFDPWQSFMTQAMANPELAKLVKRIDVRTWDSSISDDSFIVMEEFWRICTGIKRISLHDVRPIDLSKAILGISASPLSSTLRHLDLVHPVVATLPTFLANSAISLYQVLEGMPLLTSLSLQGGTIQALESIPLFTNSITTLSFTRCDIESAYPLINAVHKTLLHLTIVGETGSDDSIELLPTTCTALRSFKFSASGEIASNWLATFLTSFSSLESLDLTLTGLLDVTEEVTEVMQLDWIISAVPVAVKTLRLDLKEKKELYLERFSMWWDDELRVPNLRSLKVVGGTAEELVIRNSNVVVTFC